MTRTRGEPVRGKPALSLNWARRWNGVAGLFRARRWEWIAAAIAVLALVGGPAAALGYARWADRDTVTIRAVQWAFIPSTVYLTAGVPAHLRLISEDVTHGFILAGLDVHVDRLVPGHAVDLRFIPRKAGTYYYGCTQYCGVRHGKMLGKVIVRPPSAPQ